jgi:hypothetical protein
MNKLPIYDIVLKDDDLKQGVGRISLVDEPAIGVDWIKLRKEFNFNFKVDKEKRMLYGPFLIPNKLIYRQDDENGEYYVRFSAAEIEKIATKFNEDLNSKNINLMHTEEMVDAFVAQNWMIDGDSDKSRNLGFDLPEGTWFGGVKVKDENFWMSKVKNDEVKGFSVEILADLQLSLKNKEQIMEKEIKLGTAVLKGGVTVYWDGEFGMGTIIYVDEALTELAPDADHVLEDGTIVTTVNGEVTNIQETSVEDLADAPVAQALTAEEVSGMIDARFAELMDEITRLKSTLEQKKEEMNSFKNEVNEKFSSVPGSGSIKRPEVVRPLDTKFAENEARIKEFARTLKK